MCRYLSDIWACEETADSALFPETKTSEEAVCDDYGPILRACTGLDSSWLIWLLTMTIRKRHPESVEAAIFRVGFALRRNAWRCVLKYDGASSRLLGM